MAYLDLIDLRVEYEKGEPILDGYNLAVEEGELLSLLGPSGCGKTTTLRAVAGFIEPAGGQVIVDDQDYTHLAPNKRDIGLVFQSYALFPHLSVNHNVGFGLRMRGVRGAEMQRRVADALALVALTGYGDRRPGQLSGGQRQRVAVARAIVIEPKLLLMDEPLSNLDAKLREGMRVEIRRLQQRLGTTMLYVTHDQAEALSLSDRIVVMNKGRIEQIGPPEEIFYQPATPFVADFMGFDNHFDVQVKEIDGTRIRVQAGSHTFDAEDRHDPAGPGGQHLHTDDEAQAYFRPEAAALAGEATSNSLPGAVNLRTFRGSTVQYMVATDIGEFTVEASDADAPFDIGRVHIVFEPRSLVIMGKIES